MKTSTCTDELIHCLSIALYPPLGDQQDYVKTSAMATSSRLFWLATVAKFIVVLVSLQLLALFPFPPWLPDSRMQPVMPAKEIIPSTQVTSGRPSDVEIKSSKNNKPNWFDWEQIASSKLQSYLPEGFPEPLAAETMRNALDDDHSIPPFIQKRHKCIAHIRQLHQERFDSFLTAIRLTTQQQPFVLHVDPAYHQNVGDSLLTLGTLSMLLQQGWSDIRQCHYMQASKLVPLCEEMIPANNNGGNRTSKIAIWHPGGNWGDLYVYVHRKRIHSFDKLLKNGYSVFGFPQSLVYQDEAKGMSEAQIIKNNIGKGLNVDMDTDQGVELAKSRVFFSWREQKSYEVASELYPFATNILMPDVAFQLGPYKLINEVPSDRRVDVVLFMRKDRESVIRTYRSQPSLISETFRKVPGIKRDLSFTIVDWDDRVKLFNPELPWHHVTKEAIFLVSMGKVIVADRLHATILAYLSGVPVVYIDQISGKISKTLDVAFNALDDCRDLEAMKMKKAYNFTHALELAARLIVEDE